MKFKLHAGAELDLLTKSEMLEALDAARISWQREISRGVKFRKFSAQGVVAGGVFNIGGDTPDNRKDPLGPAEGFVWSLTRIAVSGASINPAADTYAVYTDEITPSKLIVNGLSRGATWDGAVTVLNGGERLWLRGAASAGGNDVWVAGAAIELPEHLAWQLLGK